MPQASDELRGLMLKWFGNDGNGPDAFLKSHGYVLTKHWTWELPVPYHSISCYEWNCIVFLIREWDYAGLALDNNKPTVCLCGQSKEKSNGPPTFNSES